MLINIHNLAKKKMGESGAEDQSHLEVEYVSLRKFFLYIFMSQQQQRQIKSVVHAAGPRKLEFLQNFRRRLRK